jgi:GNAT superfamily N-acetyltransferase
MSIQIEKIAQKDVPEINTYIQEFWGGSPIVAHLDLYDVDKLPGFKAVTEGELAGFLHYEVLGDACEILTLASLREGRGVGSALIQAVEDLARTRGCRLLHLTTTNDNLHALGFYQRRGFHLSQLFPGRVERSRQLKPSIPLIGDGGIPIRDEIWLEKIVGKETAS